MAIGFESKAEACSHCGSYVAETQGLCGNCKLLSQKQRDAQARMKLDISEGRRKADEAARKAYIEEMRKINKENVEDVIGDGNSIHDKADKTKKDSIDPALASIVGGN